MATDEIVLHLVLGQWSMHDAPPTHLIQNAGEGKQEYCFELLT
jgi:hypothetical protein